MSKDTIYREDAIKVLEELSACKDFGVEIGTDEETYIGKYEAITAISDLPSADRPQGWIPCSERLPNEDGQYLVWSVIGIVPDHVDDPSTYQGITIAGYYGNAHPIKWLGNVEKVLAWMPLPEPWKGADDES